MSSGCYIVTRLGFFKTINFADFVNRYMTEERFSYIVERYFRNRGTHPVTLMFKNFQVDDQFLLQLDEAVHSRFGNRDDIDLISTKLVEGDFWSGVLIEFNQNEFDGIDESSMHFGEEDVTLISHLMTLYDDFAERDTRITGVSTGSSVWAVASLESLGRDYFKTTDDVMRGPTID